MLPVKQIFVDTRQRSSDSISHSDFHIDLPVVLAMPEDTGFFIEDICLLITWWTINDNLNNCFTFRFNNITTYTSIPPGNYTTEDLGNQMVKTMNETFQTGGTKWSFTYVRPQNAIRIGFTDAWVTANPTSTFRILIDNDMRSGTCGNFTQTDLNKSFNNIIKSFTDNHNYRRAFPFTSGFVDLNTVRNVYLCCSGLGSFQL